ncbi:MAG: hypothetical protein R3D85_07870 [Paracoccaceae bacterium]
MKKPSDNPADPFKKALAEATKVMADDPELSVTYTVDPSGVSGDAMRLPQVSRRMTRDEVLLARGTADALALKHKYHDAATHARYAPQGDMARDIYEAMETARCEAVGARDMPGTAGNIDAKIANDAARAGFDRITDRAEAPLANAAGYLVRQLASGRDLPPGARNITELWQGFIEEQAGGTLEGLKDKLSDQADFARFTRQVISDLGYGDQLGDDPDAPDEDQDQDEQAEEDQQEEEGGEEQSEDQTGEADPEQTQEEQQDAAEAQVSMDEMADDEMSDQTELPEGEAPLEPPPPAPLSDADPDYRAYDTEFDEEIAAEDLAEPAELWNACGPISTSSWNR